MSHAITSQIAALVDGDDWQTALQRVMEHFSADSGTIHLLQADGMLHLAAASRGIPQFVLDKVRTVPVGKGMAGLAVERRAPVGACNIQTDTTGDVRPGARDTGLQGSIVVPIVRNGAAVGALGIASYSERTFTDDEVAVLLEIGRQMGSTARGTATIAQP
jgi:L-methionine (R)-S-oxide reductase